MEKVSLSEKTPKGVPAHQGRESRSAEQLSSTKFGDFHSMKTTPKQKRFIEEYAVDLNATQAAIRAGYAKKTAYSQGQRLLKKVEVEAAIQATLVEVSRRVEVTVDDVVAGLWAEAEGKEDSTPSSRVAAWSQLAKHLGMDRKDINWRVEQKPYDELPPEELAAKLLEVQAELDAIEAKASAIDVD